MTRWEPVGDLGDPQLNREVNLLTAALDDSPPEWWYLSFTDPDVEPADPPMPGGPSWLGACYVEAPNEVMAIRRSHEVGCNPGGEVLLMGPLPREAFERLVPVDHRDRLLTQAELKEEGLGD